jgi:hypothetical protein
MSINADTNADTNLAVVAEMYVPNIDNAGNYTTIPAVNTGIRCVVRERTRFIQDISSPAH